MKHASAVVNRVEAAITKPHYTLCLPLSWRMKPSHVVLVVCDVVRDAIWKETK